MSVNQDQSMNVELVDEDTKENENKQHDDINISKWIKKMNKNPKLMMVLVLKSMQIMGNLIKENINEDIVPDNDLSLRQAKKKPPKVLSSDNLSIIFMILINVISALLIIIYFFQMEPKISSFKDNLNLINQEAQGKYINLYKETQDLKIQVQNIQSISNKVSYEMVELLINKRPTKLSIECYNTDDVHKCTPSFIMNSTNCFCNGHVLAVVVNQIKCEFAGSGSDLAYASFYTDSNRTNLINQVVLPTGSKTRSFNFIVNEFTFNFWVINIWSSENGFKMLTCTFS